MPICVICFEEDETVLTYRSSYGCDCIYEMHSACYQRYQSSDLNRCLYCRVHVPQPYNIYNYTREELINIVNNNYNNIINLINNTSTQQEINNLIMQNNQIRNIIS